MSHLKFAPVAIVRAKNMHYALSTFAAVVYAVIWMLSNNAHAQQASPSAALPEIVITAKRPHVLPEVFVIAKRVSAEEQVASTGSAKKIVASGGGYLAKVRSWFRGG